MRLIDLKNLFANLFENIIKIEDSKIREKHKEIKINHEIDNTFNIVKKDISIDLNNLADNTINSMYKTLRRYKNLRRKGQHAMAGRPLTQKEIEIQKAERRALIEARVKGKNTGERLNRNKTKLKRDVKKAKKDPKTLNQRLGQEYRKTKNTIKNDSHRIKEKIKNYLFDRLVKNFDIEKVWNCTFRNSRDAHIAMHEQIADKDGYFYAPGGERTKSPGGFGIAKLDINCQCYVTVRRKRNEI